MRATVIVSSLQMLRPQGEIQWLYPLRSSNKSFQYGFFFSISLCAGSGLQPEPYNSIPASAHQKYSGSSYKLEPAEARGSHCVYCKACKVIIPGTIIPGTQYLIHKLVCPIKWEKGRVCHCEEQEATKQFQRQIAALRSQ